jgi:hypothetical protein
MKKLGIRDEATTTNVSATYCHEHGHRIEYYIPVLYNMSNGESKFCSQPALCNQCGLTLTEIRSGLGKVTE